MFKKAFLFQIITMCFLSGCGKGSSEQANLYESIEIDIFEKEISISEDLEIPFSAQNYNNEISEKYMLNWKTDYGKFIKNQNDSELDLGVEVLGSEYVIWKSENNKIDKKYFYVKMNIVEIANNKIVKTINIDFEKRENKLILKH